MQGDARGTYGSGCKVPRECREMCVGAKCPGNAVECRGMPGERKLAGGKCKGNGGESH